MALPAGDDYELLFTADPAERARLTALVAGVVLRRIGAITAAGDVLVDGATAGSRCRSRFRPLRVSAEAPGEARSGSRFRRV